MALFRWLITAFSAVMTMQAACRAEAACDFGRSPPNLTDRLAVPAAIQAKASAQAARYRELARYWSPVISQDIDSANIRADYITNYDFDGDVIATNNWDNLNSSPLKPYVYYWVIEAPTRYYIGYAFFHPRDWTSEGNFQTVQSWDSNGIQHENDMEGVILSIVRDSSEHGRFEALISEAHGEKYSFADDDTPHQSTWFPLVALSQDLEGEDEDVDFVVDDIGFHPVVYIQAEGHGTYGHPFANKGPHTLDDWIPIFISNKVTNWRGQDWSGTPYAQNVGIVLDEDRRKNWGDGIVYHFEETADDVGPPGVVANNQLISDWRIAGYDLVSINYMWECRADTRVFASRQGGFQPKGDANAPWNWGGTFFADPASLMAEQLDHWTVTLTQPCGYTGNSLGTGPGCIPPP